MQVNQVIKVSSEAGEKKYLSDVMEYLPKNCLFDKGKTGCGGTNVALTNDLNYVIAVPYQSLIESKSFQISNVLGVMEGVSNKEIREYVQQEGVKKIMVTYDSIERVIDEIDPSKYALLLDEYHLLFTEMAYREDAIYKVLNNYTKFNEFCFMTATPLEDEFIIDELKHLPVVRCEWENVETVSVHLTKCETGVAKTAIETINSYLINNNENKNLHIFVNSVDFIDDMVKNCNLTVDNTRAIWSKNNPKKISIQRRTINDPVKKINFYTSTCFEGCDVYDKNGVILVVSDGSKKNTLIDITTKFQQIAGRIRDTIYFDNITLLYSGTRYSNNLTYDEFKAKCEEEIARCKSLIVDFNESKDSVKPYISVNDIYIKRNSENGTFEFNPNLVKLDLYNFKVARCIYQIRVNKNVVSDELVDKGYFVISSSEKSDVNLLKLDTDKKGFEQSVLRIKAHRENSCSIIINQVESEEKARYPFIIDAINTFGFAGLEDMKYKVTNVKRKLLVRNPSSSQLNKMFKIAKSFNVGIGDFISASDAKSIVSKTYDELYIKRTAKGSDLNTLFIIDETTKRIDGKVVKGYIIKGNKAIFSE